MFELFDSGTYTQVPTIIGVNSEEKITMANGKVFNWIIINFWNTFKRYKHTF